MGQVDSTVEVFKAIPLEESTSLSTAIVNYVKKTGENIVLGDAASDKRFISDPYIAAKRPKSILCAPIKHKGVMAGIIYLENNLTAHAFTPERLKILQIFSAQAAIAIENAILYEKQKENFDNLNKIFSTTVNAMALAIEARDPYTAGHQRRVADLASNIASELKLSQKMIDGIRIAGLIHDIGKISIPAEILTKPGKLTTIEFNLIKSHPQSGYDILNPIEFPWPVAEIVHQHHEKLDGSGYPSGLTEKVILTEAKIITIADVVEAMASHRPYRASLGIDKALEEIRINSGKLYDRDVAEACFQIFKNGYKLIGDI
jgi:putative nucleotidyltransferase with HDIG domain